MDGKSISKLPRTRLYRINGELYLASRNWTAQMLRSWYENTEQIKINDWEILSFYEKTAPGAETDFSQVIEATQFTPDDLPMQLIV